MSSEWKQIEEAVCESMPFCIQQEPDTDGTLGNDWYDATFLANYHGTEQVPLLGTDNVGTGTRGEIKTCMKWQKNGSKRRRGRWVFHSVNHQTRLDNDAVYILGERESECAVVATAEYVDELLEGKWTTGDGSGRGDMAALRWSVVLDPDRVDPDGDEVE